MNNTSCETIELTSLAEGELTSGEAWYVRWTDEKGKDYLIGPFVGKEQAEVGLGSIEWVVSLLERGQSKEAIIELMLFNQKKGHDTAPICRFINSL